MKKCAIVIFFFLGSECVRVYCALIKYVILINEINLSSFINYIYSLVYAWRFRSGGSANKWHFRSITT